MFLVVVSALDSYGVLGLQRQFHTPLVVDVTSRQRAFVERYIKDVVLKLDGVPADPNEDAGALMKTADGLLDGGMVPSPQGNLDDLIAVPRPGNSAVRIKLTHERELIRELIGQGKSLLAEGKRGTDVPRRSARAAHQGRGTVERHRRRGRRRGPRRPGPTCRASCACSSRSARSARSRPSGWPCCCGGPRSRQSGRFRSLVHNSTDLITVVDEHAVATYQSPSSARVLGYEWSEILGTTLTELLHPDDKSEVVGALRRPARTRRLDHRSDVPAPSPRRCVDHDGRHRAQSASPTAPLAGS